MQEKNKKIPASRGKGVTFVEAFLKVEIAATETKEETVGIDL